MSDPAARNSDVPVGSMLRRSWRFIALLLASLLLATAPPWGAGLFSEQGWFAILVSVLIAAVLILVLEERGHRRLAVTLAALSLAGIWVSLGVGEEAGRWILVAAYLLAALLFAFALYGILRRILAQQASGNAIFGAACGYLLLGIIWSLLYYAVETATPGSFRVPAPRGGDVAEARDFLGYYSFITLATVGYGDVTPATPLARALAWIEAVAGQLYLAILVAGLVGFKVAQAMKT